MAMRPLALQTHGDAPPRMAMRPLALQTHGDAPCVTIGMAMRPPAWRYAPLRYKRMAMPPSGTKPNDRGGRYRFMA